MEIPPCIYNGLGWRSDSAGHGYCIFLLIIFIQLFIVSAETQSQDAAALSSLANSWQHTPSNWKGSDPCGDNWVGINCTDSRITSIALPSMRLVGTLTGDIASLSELQSLDFSYNNLTGPLNTAIGNLTKLETLLLVGCSFSGEIPKEIGSLSRLRTLSLTSNHFTGSIPASLGNLANLYLLDLHDNQLTGEIPVSDGTKPGLDMLKNTKHFHFGMNRLSGAIPSKLFNSEMRLIHLLLDNNNLSGSIPSTLGLVTTLEVLRLDRNTLSGPVPSNLNNLTKIAELHLANNTLTGPLPNLTGMTALTFVDMSVNTFDESNVPPWFSTLPSLMTLYLEYLKIGGQIPQALFSNSQLQTLKLRNNRFNGTLDLGIGYSNQLQYIDLQNNDITNVTGGYNKELILIGNPICNIEQSTMPYCKVLEQSTPPYSSIENCHNSCPSDQIISPNCKCAYPYTGTLYFISPPFSDFENVTYCQTLKDGLLKKFVEDGLPVDSVSVDNPFGDPNGNLEMTLEVFPTGKIRFNEAEVATIGFILSNQTYRPPKSIYGPYYFIGRDYPAGPSLVAQISKSNQKLLIIGVSIGAGVILLLVVITMYVIFRRKKQNVDTEKSQSIGSWSNIKSGSLPQLKGARQFSFEELRKYTNNFAESNNVGKGGYGKVYRGIFENGQLVAIKRAQQESKQGINEFNTEIELLSRVHHKNLVSLIGFCIDEDEQILVYEYVPNGSLRESLLGKSGVRLDWPKRLRVALGSARGLAYLHELADPPIVHRDIKSSNILLDDNLNGKVSDFGLSKPLEDDIKGYVSTQVKGTMGYVDPEYYMTQQLTEKSDVYSFGVLLLEMVTAKKPIERGHYIVREIITLLDKTKDLYGLQHILDPALGSGTTLAGFDKFIDLAMKCVEESGKNRPAMSEVVKEIESIMQFAGINPNADSASNSSNIAGQSKSPDGKLYSTFDYSGDPPAITVEPK